MTIPHPCELDDPIYMPSTHGSIRGALSGMRACFFDRILVTKKLRVKKKQKIIIRTKGENVKHHMYRRKYLSFRIQQYLAKHLYLFVHTHTLLWQGCFLG